MAKKKLESAVYHLLMVFHLSIWALVKIDSWEAMKSDETVVLIITDLI